MNHFFAYVSRLRLIRRWGLMRNTFPENDQEHALQAAMIAQALAIIGNVRYGKAYDVDRIAALAIFHDAGEVLTGDIATPIKHFNPEVGQAFDHLERMARDKLLTMLPEDLRVYYAAYLIPDETSPEWAIIKAADRICAYVKCVEEVKAGNGEFLKAKEVILASIERLALDEVRDFMREFAESFAMTLDELN